MLFSGTTQTDSTVACVCVMVALSSFFAIAQTAPKMKMTTHIPPQITTATSQEN